MTIEYRNDAGELVATMRYGITEDNAHLVAQRYMSQSPPIRTAHILTDTTETVITKTTAWQKNN